MMRNTCPKNIPDQIFSNQLFWGGNLNIPPISPESSVFLFTSFLRKPILLAAGRCRGLWFQSSFAS